VIASPWTTTWPERIVSVGPAAPPSRVAPADPAWRVIARPIEKVPLANSADDQNGFRSLVGVDGRLQVPAGAAVDGEPRSARSRSPAAHEHEQAGSPAGEPEAKKRHGDDNSTMRV
jgi:hypothetical protein